MFLPEENLIQRAYPLLEVEEELIVQGRKAMIESGTFDEFTRVSNVVEDGKNLFGFVKGLFGKKK